MAPGAVQDYVVERRVAAHGVVNVLAVPRHGLQVVAEGNATVVCSKVAHGKEHA